MVRPLILLNKEKMLALRLFNGTRPEDPTRSGDQFLPVLEPGESNLAMPPAKLSQSRTTALKTEESSRSEDRAPQRLGESKDSSHNE